MEWLLAPIDPARAHEVGFAVSWHGRSMVIGWGVLAPLAVIIARFFKVLPGQDWPQVLDVQFWWRGHWMGQTTVVGLTIFGVALVLPGDLSTMTLHNWLGYGLIAVMALQVLLGIFRGNKGGPTAPAADGSWRGHHYDMTAYRRTFELLHKGIGYFALVLAALAIALGLWKANAPIWMWLSIHIWWLVLIAAFVFLQKRGMAVDTYQAIWGADQKHPGNRRPKPGWGVRRLGDGRGEDLHVRSD